MHINPFAPEVHARHPKPTVPVSISTLTGIQITCYDGMQRELKVHNMLKHSSSKRVKGILIAYKTPKYIGQRVESIFDHC